MGKGLGGGPVNSPEWQGAILPLPNGESANQRRSVGPGRRFGIVVSWRLWSKVLSISADCLFPLLLYPKSLQDCLDP